MYFNNFTKKKYILIKNLSILIRKEIYLGLSNKLLGSLSANIVFRIYGLAFILSKAKKIISGFFIISYELNYFYS